MEQPRQNIKTVINKKNMLDRRLDELETKLKAILSEMEVMRNERDKTQRYIEQLCKSPQISDHAKLRYMQRVWNLDLSPIEDEIFTPETIDKIMSIGSGELLINVKNKDIIIVVRNNIITTIKNP